MTETAQKLVSVIVVSYNSSATIIDTLDSIYAQTYSNIELIITDDASSDDTVAVAQQWALEHGHRFANCIVHANPQNQGVPGNLNTGIRLSHGYYIKDLAADDLLLPDCVEQNVVCCQENGYNNLFSRVRPFCVRDEKKVICDDIPFDPLFFTKEAAAQYQDMLVENRVFSPTFFVARAFIEQMGLYDTRYRYMEDYPMYLKIPKLGYKINFLDAYTVEYRLSDSSLSNVTQNRIVHPGYYRTLKDFFFKVRMPGLLRYCKLKRIIGELRRFFYTDLIVIFGNNRQRSIVRFLENLKNRTLFKKKDI